MIQNVDEAFAANQPPKVVAGAVRLARQCGVLFGKSMDRRRVMILAVIEHQGTGRSATQTVRLG